MQLAYIGVEAQKVLTHLVLGDMMGAEAKISGLLSAQEA